MAIGNQNVLMTCKCRCTHGLFFFVVLVLTLSAVHIANAQDEVSYRLKWLINMSTVGDIVALQQGCFAEEGLDVLLKAGGPERDAIRELEMGYADFGVASADQVVYAIAKGSPVVVLAQLFQVNPLQWIYFKDKINIDNLADLKDRTIGVTFGKNDELIMRTLLAKSGIAIHQVRLYSVRLDYTPFYKGAVDLWPVYINTQGVEIGHKLISSGVGVAFLNPAAHGVRFVANSVVTSEQLLEKRPQLVHRFMRALIKGWTMVLDRSLTEQVIDDVQQYDRDTPRHLLVDELNATRSLIQPNRETPVGHINPAAWEQTEKIMLTYKQIKKPVNVITRLRPVYVK